MLLAVSVLLLLIDQVGRCASESDSALFCDDNDDVVSSCDQSTSAHRNCRCDELCPAFADCCRDYRQPVAANSLRGR